jgi:hypothetical protein
MASAELRFSRRAENLTLGRNGFSYAEGVYVSERMGDALIEPVNSKGDIGRARIVVPLEDVPELIKSLQRIASSAAHSGAVDAPNAGDALLKAAEALLRGVWACDVSIHLAREIDALEAAIDQARGE